MTLLPSRVSRDSAAKMSPQTTTVPLEMPTSRSGAGSAVILRPFKRVAFSFRCRFAKLIETAVGSLTPLSRRVKPRPPPFPP